MLTYTAPTQHLDLLCNFLKGGIDLFLFYYEVFGFTHTEIYYFNIALISYC